MCRIIICTGEHVLRPPDTKTAKGGDGTAVSCVAISSCGNFGVVGTAGGRIDRYNMQSGLHRGTYARPTPEDTTLAVSSGSGNGGGGREEVIPNANGSGGGGGSGVGGKSRSGVSPTELLPAHSGAVSGLTVGASNRTLATVGLDGMLRTWNFRQQKLTGAGTSNPYPPPLPPSIAPHPISPPWRPNSRPPLAPLIALGNYTHAENTLHSVVPPVLVDSSGCSRVLPIWRH